MTGRFSRRYLLSLGVAASTAMTLGLSSVRRAGAQQAKGTAVSAGASATPQPAKVDEKDSLALALGYVSDAGRVDPKASPTYKSGASCSTCSWYQGKPGDAGGPCTFFPGKLVDAHGWCRMWNRKQ